MTTIAPTYPAHIAVSQAEVRLVADQTSNAVASTIKLDQQSVETAEQIEQAAAKSSVNIITWLSVTPPETTHQRPLHHFIRHLLNLRHVVVVNGLLTAIVPFDGYARPIRFSDGALIGSIVLPANAVADVKLSCSPVI
jgi:hypothetical protein